MKNSKAELTVGIFALVVLAILSFMTFKVGEFTFLEKKGYTVYCDFRNTAGLDEKTKVKVAGVDAGTVEKISLVGEKARVWLRIDSDVVLYSDATASIKSTGLLGDKYLNVRPGSVRPLLNDGEEIVNVSEIADIDDLVKNLTEISRRLVEFIEDVNQQEYREALKTTLVNLRDITGDLKLFVSENKENFTDIMGRFNTITARIEEFLNENTGPFTNTVANFEEFSVSVREKGPDMIENLNQAAQDLRKVLEEAGPELTSVAKKANTTMDTLSGISNKIESGEGTLGKLVQDEQLYESLTNAAKGLDRTLSSVERFRTFVTFRNDYLTEIEENKGAFYLTLQPREDKYYVIGAVKDPVGTARIKETTVDGVTTRKETIFEDKIEFTAHFAKRYKDTALRIGLTESTFGVGADQFFLDDKLVASLDVWDFNENEQFSDKAHLRFGVDYFVFKNLFIAGGYDNVLDSDRRGLFFGGGLKFEDEDLKFLLGPASNFAGK